MVSCQLVGFPVVIDLLCVVSSPAKPLTCGTALAHDISGELGELSHLPPVVCDSNSYNGLIWII